MSARIGLTEFLPRLGIAGLALTLLAGVLIGATGIGGVLLVPILNGVEGLSLSDAIAASALAFAFPGALAIWRLRRSSAPAHAQGDALALWLMLGALPGAMLGAAWVHHADTKVLLGLLALVALFSGGRGLMKRPVASQASWTISRRLAIFLGAVVGLGSGLTGTGGPVLLMPLLMALLGIWNRNFLGATTHNIAPYASPLGKFASFLQQMDMESNGKGTHVDGSPVEIATAPVLWGGLGIDGQHAYFQLIHQGKHLVPMDFIGLRTERSPLPFAAEHHRVVLLNMQAQAQALAIGRTPEETMRELRDSGMDEAEVQRLAPHRSYPGNVPSTTIWVDALTPRSMGALMALYEHKVFCQAAIWGIHAYDQWGVELGKKMAKDIEAAEAARLKA